MKYLLILLMICEVAYAQEPPYTPMKGNYKFKGIKVDSLFLIPSFADTTAANGTYLDSVAGAMIRTGNDFWMRNAELTSWLQNVNVGPGSNPLNVLYPGDSPDRINGVATNDVIANMHDKNLTIDSTQVYIVNSNLFGGTSIFQLAGNNIYLYGYDYSGVSGIEIDPAYSVFTLSLKNNTAFLSKRNFGTDTLAMLGDLKFIDTIYRKSGKDSIFWKKNNIEYKIKDSTGGGGSTPTLQQVLDNNHDLTNGRNYQGTGAGAGNTGSDVNSFGSDAASDNKSTNVNALGNAAGRGNEGRDLNSFGYLSGYFNTGLACTFMGKNAGQSNTGNYVIAIGDSAGRNNTFNNLTLLGKNTVGKAGNQLVLADSLGYQTRLWHLGIKNRDLFFPQSDGTFSVTYARDSINVSTSNVIADRPGIYVIRTAGIGTFRFPDNSQGLFDGQELTLWNRTLIDVSFAGTASIMEPDGTALISILRGQANTYKCFGNQQWVLISIR